MRRRAVHIASAMAGALIVASLATGLVGTDLADQDAPSDPTEPAESHQHDGEHAHGDVEETNGSSDGYEGPQLEAAQPRHDHALSGGDGEIPSRAEASELPHQFEDFIVEGNDGLAEMDERGYLDGSGTTEDPYVISGFRVKDDLKIEDVSKALVIKNSYIEGQLSLNFVGEDVSVHHNHVYDLRVNENVRRDGPTTAGLFEHNEIEFIGQLRHFGGTFAHNEIGPRPDGVVDTYLSDTGPEDLPDAVVWNYDGYHGAHTHNNTVIGRVDVQLHGHFHGSCQLCPSHDHADPDGFPADNAQEPGHAPRSEHSYRFHTLDFENNSIRADEQRIALRFLDEGHAGDDQTANSEPNAYLEDRHEHHQYLRVAGNHLEGGSLVFDIVNADDPDRHGGLVQEALVDLVSNTVELDAPTEDDGLRAAYLVHAADNLEMDARENSFVFHEDDDSEAVPAGYRWMVSDEGGRATGFLFHQFDATTVDVVATDGEGADYGVTLDRVRDNSKIRLDDNEFRASEEDEHHA